MEIEFDNPEKVLFLLPLREAKAVYEAKPKQILIIGR